MMASLQLSCHNVLCHTGRALQVLTQQFIKHVTHPPHHLPLPHWKIETYLLAFLNNLALFGSKNRYIRAINILNHGVPVGKYPVKLLCVLWPWLPSQSTEARNGHSRSQSPRFFWSRGQRNEGLW